MVLADLDAEVVKVEEPGAGDEPGRFGPFQNGVSTDFFSINRGKKGLSLNLKAEEVLAQWRHLAPEDVARLRAEGVV
jgi:crotonobetainyl-CoA:carnitine CoA-transferase CaiB-like acyl-CoA transferase